MFGRALVGVWTLVGKLGSADRLPLRLVALDAKWLFASRTLLLELFVNWTIIRLSRMMDPFVRASVVRDAIGRYFCSMIV